MTSRARSGQAGFTLLEVIIALAIFVASFAALSQLFTIGSRAAVQSALQTQAAMRAEAKMAEVVAGVESFEAANEVPFEDDANWTWGLAVNPGPHTDVYELVVTVTYQAGNEPSPTSFALVRFRRDPQLILDAAAAAAEAESE